MVRSVIPGAPDTEVVVEVDSVEVWDHSRPDEALVSRVNPEITTAPWREQPLVDVACSTAATVVIVPKRESETNCTLRKDASCCNQCLRKSQLCLGSFPSGNEYSWTTNTPVYTCALRMCMSHELFTPDTSKRESFPHDLRIRVD